MLDDVSVCNFSCLIDYTIFSKKMNRVYVTYVVSLHS